MPRLETLILTDFRSYTHRRFEFTGDRVALVGPNGAGKTNVLEAIYFGSILRSFRTGAVRELVRLGASRFGVEIGLERENLCIVQQRGGGRALGINSAPVRKSSEFIREFRAVPFVPEDIALASGAAAVRRRWFDMLLAVTVAGYLGALQHYARGLRQRNAALRANSPEAVIAAFDADLTRSAALLGAARGEWCARVGGELRALDPAADYAVEYLPNFAPDAESFARQLGKSLERDRRVGFTGPGPQGDEFRILRGGNELRLYGSAGQRRMAALHLKMAEFRLLDRASDSGVVALVDDVTGELDARRRAEFFELLRGARQIFYTFAGTPPADAGELERIDLGSRD